MARLLTHVDEVIANCDPREPFDWFRAYGSAKDLQRQEDRCSLFLGFDADRKQNSVRGMVDWFTEFQAMLADIDQQRFATTVFVLDWSDECAREAAASIVRESQLTDEEIDELLDAGICYRVKDEQYSKKGTDGFVEALRQDLVSKRLIPGSAELTLGEPVPAKPAPDESIDEVRDTMKFLASGQFVWSNEDVRKLFQQ